MVLSCNINVRRVRCFKFNECRSVDMVSLLPVLYYNMDIRIYGSVVTSVTVIFTKVIRNKLISHFICAHSML